MFSVSLGRVVEIGPGYGRLLRHMLKEGIRFAKFTGFDISQSRVHALTTELRTGTRQSRMEFKLCDVMAQDFGQTFDTLLCSSTFEHFYPDCGPVVQNIAKNLAKGGRLFIDFPNWADDPDFKYNSISPGSGEYVRFYAEQEVRAICAEAGIELQLHPVCHAVHIRSDSAQAREGPELPGDGRGSGRGDSAFHGDWAEAVRRSALGQHSPASQPYRGA